MPANGRRDLIRRVKVNDTVSTSHSTALFYHKSMTRDRCGSGGLCQQSWDSSGQNIRGSCYSILIQQWGWETDILQLHCAGQNHTLEQACSSRPNQKLQWGITPCRDWQAAAQIRYKVLSINQFGTLAPRVSHWAQQLHSHDAMGGVHSTTQLQALPKMIVHIDTIKSM